MQGSRKASRQILFDYNDIDSTTNDDFYNDNYDNDDSIPTHAPPRRSVTLSDFLAPGLLSKDDSNDNIDEDSKSPGVHNEGGSNDFDEYDAGFEEDYDDYDSKQIDRCFEEINKRYDISKCDKYLIIEFLRDCDYNLSDLWRNLKEGEFGPIKPKPKSKPQNQKPQQPKAQLQKGNNATPTIQHPGLPPPTGSGQIQFASPNSQKSAPKVNLPSRSHSTSALNKITEQHQCATYALTAVKASLSGAKKHLNLVVIGHVDAGKSTLMGHLLLLQGKVSHSKMSSIEKASKQLGKEEDKYAWIMAEDEVERSRGVTIDVAMVDFETDHLNITILDAPGHRDFVPNMIAGASQADAALLVIDAGNTNFERGQAKEHLFLCRSLGVQSIVVAINKMDTVHYDEAVFNDVSKQITTFLRSSLGIQPLRIIPTAATLGYNLDRPAPDMPWYTGPTVLSAIDEIPPPQISQLLDTPFLLCISQSVEAGNRSLIVTGRVETGYVCKGDVVKIQPGAISCMVHDVRTGAGKSIEYAIAGQLAEIVLQTQVSSENVPPGSSLSDLGRTIPYSNSFIARVVTFQMPVPLMRGSDLVFYRHAVDMPLHIVEILSVTNKKQKKMSNAFVPSNSIAEIAFRLDAPITLEKFQESKSFGRFIIRARGETLGFGSVSEVKPNFQPSQQKFNYDDD